MNRFPWWLSVILAILCYYSLKYGLPQLIAADDRLSGLFALLAPISAMGFLLLAAKQLYDGNETKQSEDQADQGQVPNDKE